MSRTPRPLQAVPDTELTRAPVCTEAADKIWAALHAHPGSTTAELATTAGAGRSTAAKALAAWDSEGTVQRTTCITENGRRGADRWSITPPTSEAPALDPAEALALGTGSEPLGAEPTEGDDTGEPGTHHLPLSRLLRLLVNTTRPAVPSSPGRTI